MDFNKIKAMGLEYAEKGKNAAMDLAEKGKTQALLVNEQGKVLSDTNRGGDYVGPQAVLEDARRILQQYRQRHPRQT